MAQVVVVKKVGTDKNGDTYLMIESTTDSVLGKVRTRGFITLVDVDHDKIKKESEGKSFELTAQLNSLIRWTA